MRRNYFILKLLIIFIVLFSSFQIFPQSNKFDIEYITTQDGLSSACVPKIIQDSQGFMWFATEGGLNRYDGYNIKHYDCGEKVIRTIFEDPADSGKILWIGTGGELFKFETENEKFIKLQLNDAKVNNTSQTYITCIYKDRDGFYWIGTEGAGLYMFNPKTGRLIRYLPDPNESGSLSPGCIFAICQDYLGYLWIGTVSGLDRFDRKTKKFNHYKYDPNNPHTLESDHIYSLFEDSDKILWIGTLETLFKYDRKNDRFIRPLFYNLDKPFIIKSQIFSITEDNQKTLWFSYGTGVCAVPQDRKNIKFYSDSSNVSLTSSVCIDRSGNIWIGTYCSGIQKLKGETK